MNDATKSATSELAEWRLVWLKAVAMAWHKPEFEKDLLEDARKALKSHLNYDLPANLHIKVVATKGTDSQWKDVEGSWSLSPEEVTLYLPPRPSDVNDKAIAFSELDESSARSFPEICCL